MNERLHKRTGPKHHWGVHAALGENKGLIIKRIEL